MKIIVDMVVSGNMREICVFVKTITKVMMKINMMILMMIAMMRMKMIADVRPGC